MTEAEFEELCRQQTNSEALETYYGAFMRIARAAYDKGYENAKDKAWEFHEPSLWVYTGHD